MSGGDLDYIYGRVEEAAFQIIRKATNPHQKAFGRHLLLVSQALHDIEWVFSGDYEEGDDLVAIQKVLPEGFFA